MNLSPVPRDPFLLGWEDAVLKRFLIAAAIFIGLVVPGALLFALMAASAYPSPAMRAQSATKSPAVITAPYLRPSSVVAGNGSGNR